MDLLCTLGSLFFKAGNSIYSPLDGLSEYLVQKTHAGQSCPLGPRTIPGGTSPSFFGSELEPPSPPPLDVLSMLVGFDDKSTGLLLLFIGDVATAAGLGGLGRGSCFMRLSCCCRCCCCCCAAAAATTAMFCKNCSLCPKAGLRMLSMENGSMLGPVLAIAGPGRNGWKRLVGGEDDEASGDPIGDLAEFAGDDDNAGDLADVAIGGGGGESVTLSSGLGLLPFGGEGFVGGGGLAGSTTSHFSSSSEAAVMSSSTSLLMDTSSSRGDSLSVQIMAAATNFSASDCILSPMDASPFLPICL